MANPREHQDREDCKCYVCGARAGQSRRLVTVDAAARLCRVSRSTLYRWMREGVVEWIVLPGGRRRVCLDSLFRDAPAFPLL